MQLLGKDTTDQAFFEDLIRKVTKPWTSKGDAKDTLELSALVSRLSQEGVRMHVAAPADWVRPDLTVFHPHTIYHTLFN